MELISDLRQRHLEAWEKSFNELRGDDKGASRYYGAVVRAAINAGWFRDPVPVDDVDEMTPRQVRAYARAVDTAYTEATTLDPN